LQAFQEKVVQGMAPVAEAQPQARQGEPQQGQVAQKI
jgi:hypothetical protein